MQRPPVLVTLCLFLLGCGGEPITMPRTPEWPSLADIPTAQWDRLAAKRILFGHQSVGADLLSGMRLLLDENPRIRLRILSADQGVVAGPGFLEAVVGENGDPGSKATAFRTFVERRKDVPGAIAMYKHCYLDVRASTDVRRMFEAYRAGIDEVRARHPDLTIAHITIPLATAETAAVAIVKRALGRTTARDLNAKRNEFNRLLRRTYAGREPLFDLARLESTRPDGSRSYFRAGSDTVFTLAPDWTDDGGHLNPAGQRALAEQFLIFLSRL